MVLPNFLIIGAQKSGTTALYHYLRQHPQVYMSPEKEPHFFALEDEGINFRGPRDKEILNHIAVTDIEDYKELFAGVTGEKAVGEASAVYLYSSRAPERIKRRVPEAKMIAVLRHPAERAYSSFLHMVRDDREPLDNFGRALDEEEIRIRDNWGPIWHYRRSGFYYGQLQRYFEAFGRDRVRVYLYEDFTDDPHGVLQDVFRFLDVDPTFSPDTTVRHNVAGVPKSKALHAAHNLLIRPHPLKTFFKPLFPEKMRRSAIQRMVNSIRNRNLVKPPFPEEVRARLVADYKEDVLKLQDLIGRDLSEWLV